MTDRSAYTAGLRQLADLLDANEALPIPYSGGDGTPLAMYLLNHNPETRDRFAAVVRALPGKRTKEAEPSSGTFRVAATFGGEGGLRVEVVAYRETVCERVVKGSREVEVPATPEQVIPAREARVEVVEDVEWICSPLLAPADA